MKNKQLVNISVIQSSKVIAILYFVLSAIICLPVGIYLLFTAGFEQAFVYFLFPVIYLVLAFLGMALFFWTYNLIARSLGGIEFTTKE